MSSDRQSVKVAAPYPSRLSIEKASMKREEKGNAVNKQCSHLKGIPSGLAPANKT